MTHRKYLFIGAHPDDVELNAGGTIAELGKAGKTVSVVVCSHTPTSQRGVESLMALEALGVDKTNVTFLGMVEPNLHDSLPAIITGIEKAVVQHDPHVVFTHFHADTHQDHEAVCRATMVGARFVPSLYMYCPTYPSGRTNLPMSPNLVSFFSEDSMRDKLRALSMFHSQKVKYGCESWLRSVESVARGDAWRVGGKHGCAELFQISRTDYL